MPYSHANMPPLIPRDVLFGSPEKMNVKISPDGKYLSYCAPDERDVLQIWIGTIGANDARPVTRSEKQGIREYLWTFLPSLLLYLQDTEGDEDWHVYCLDVESGKVRDMTPFPKIHATIVALRPECAGEALVAMNIENPKVHDVYRLDIRTGRLDLDTKNPGGVNGWTADWQMAVRAVKANNPDGSSDLLVRDAPDRPWEKIQHWTPDEVGWELHFSQDGKILYFAGNHETNTMRFIARDMQTRHNDVLVEDLEYDVLPSEFVVQPATGNLQAVGYQRDKLAWAILDPQINADFEALQEVRPGELHIDSRDLADKTWAVSFKTDDGPIYHYLYDRPSQSATLLFSHRSKLEGLPLSPMEPISFASRDGLTLHGYLSLPVGVDPEKLPTILFVHGGPWARDSWGFKPLIQWLANRGYAVLQINFRGSDGYGKAFLNAGNREWGGKMHDDLIDGVRWIVDKGIADPERVGIMGSSYGGYAVLVGLAFTPDVFAVGVDEVGISNLVTFLKSIPSYWLVDNGKRKHRIGDVDTEDEFLKSRSPLFFADRIQAPLLIGQGANDVRVKQAESEQIVEAMRSAGKPVKYVVYADEGHNFLRSENRRHMRAIEEEFLATYLGGRFEPAGEIPGHSGTIK